MNKRLKTAQQLGDASLAIRVQRICEGLVRGQLPTALAVMGVTRSILYRWPRMARFATRVRQRFGNKVLPDNTD